MGLIDQHRLKGQRLLQGHVLPVHLDGSDQLAAFRHLWKSSPAAEEGVPQWLPAGAAGVPQHVPGGLCGGIRAVLHRLSHGADQGSPADSHLWVLLDFLIPKWRINLWNSVDYSDYLYGQRRTAFGTFKRILKTDGISGLYRGLLPMMCR